MNSWIYNAGPYVFSHDGNTGLQARGVGGCGAFRLSFPHQSSTVSNLSKKKRDVGKANLVLAVSRSWLQTWCTVRGMCVCVLAVQVLWVQPWAMHTAPGWWWWRAAFWPDWASSWLRRPLVCSTSTSPWVCCQVNRIIYWGTCPMRHC